MKGIQCISVIVLGLFSKTNWIIKILKFIKRSKIIKKLIVVLTRLIYLTWIEERPDWVVFRIDLNSYRTELFKILNLWWGLRNPPKQTFTSSKSTIKTLKFFINNDTTTMSLTSLWCLYCEVWTDFTPYSSISIVGLEHINVFWELGPWFTFLPTPKVF